MSEFTPDFHHFQNFWIEQQKNAKHMEKDAAWAHIEGFIQAHNTCGFATGYGDYVRCTPIEYTYMDGCFYSNTSDEFKKLLAFKGIPYDVLKAAAVEVAVVRVVPSRFEMYDTDFVKQGYDVRQIIDKEA